MKASRLLFSTTAAVLAVVFAPVPAYASEDLEIVFAPSPVELRTGDPAVDTTVSLTAGSAESGYELTVETELRRIDDEVSYEVLPGPGCEPDGDTDLTCLMDPGETVSFVVRFTPEPESELEDGERDDGRLEVVVGAANTGSDHEFEEKEKLQVGLTGGTTVPAGVPGVSGTVSDGDGAPLSDAEVTVTDSQGSEFTGSTDGDGAFLIEPSAGETIAPGELTVEATADGKTPTTVTVTGVSGETAMVAFSMAAAAATAPPAAQEETGGGSLWPYLLIAAGLLAVGALLAVLVMRGRSRKADAHGHPSYTPAQTPAGYVNPPTLAYGQVDGDDDLARYGSGGSGFGPAYGHGDEPTQEIDPRMPPR